MKHPRPSSECGDCGAIDSMVALFQQPAGAKKCERLSAGSEQRIVSGARETLRVEHSSMCAHAQTVTRATIRLVRQLKSQLNEACRWHKSRH